MRYSIDVALWLAVVGLFAAVVVHIMASFGTTVEEEWGFAVPMHVVLISVGGFTAMMYRVRGESWDATAFPSWCKRPVLVLFGYLVLNLVLLTKFEGDKTFQLRCLSSGWLVGYAAVAAYLIHLREGLRPGFRQVEFRD